MVAIDRRAQTIETMSGESIAYDHLVLALGSRVRRLEVEGSDLGGVHYLRNIEDVQGIRAQMKRTRDVVIVGAGYIGLEVAAVARELGHAVTVLEMEDRVMSRVVSPVVSDFFAAEPAAG